MTEVALHPYSTYRDSGLPWLGKIPEHWVIRRAKYLYREVDDRSTTGNEELLSVSHLTGVTPRREKNVTMFMAESNVGHKICQPGDLVINTMWAWMAALGVAAQEGLVSPSYGVYRPLSNDLLPGYADRLLRTAMYAAEYTRRSTGVNSSRLRLYPDQFLRIPIMVPPVDEQQAMVRFINHLDRLVGRFIHAKRQLIDLLEEKKKIVIYRTVTRGINPEVQLRLSGVEWIGEVPEHWVVAALRHRYSQNLGKMLDAKRITGQHLVPYLRNTDVQWDRINTEDLPTMDISPEEFERYTVRTGDLLVCEGGEVGRSAIWLGESSTYGYQKALHRLRPYSMDTDVPRFLYHAMRAAASSNAFSDGHVSTIAHLTGDKLRAHRFAFPPRSEQQEIVDHLDASLGSTDQLISAAYQEMTFLREYRTRLITDVVTGQLDVRQAAASLPNEANESGEMPLADDMLEEEDEADLGMDDLVEEDAG